jgi:hypothetical protein
MSLECQQQQQQPEANRLVPDNNQCTSLSFDSNPDDVPQPGPSSDGHQFVSRSALGAGGIRSPRSAAGKTCTVHIKEPASETRDYEKTDDAVSHGPLHRAIPVMHLGLAIFCCVLNILLPGSGTLVAAFSLLHGSTTTRLRSKARAFGLNVLVAVLQLGTFVMIVGWIWSILWGMTFIQLAISESRTSQGRRTSMSYYVRRHSSVVV